MQTIPMSQIRALASHTHWFDADSMRFFKSKLPATGVSTGHKNYFISSEMNPSGLRAYSIRQQDVATGSISTLGEFHSYSTRSDAVKALKTHLGE